MALNSYLKKNNRLYLFLIHYFKKLTYMDYDPKILRYIFTHDNMTFDCNCYFVNTICSQ